LYCGCKKKKKNEKGKKRKGKKKKKYSESGSVVCILFMNVFSMIKLQRIKKNLIF
jgi:hypothetical protein